MRHRNARRLRVRSQISQALDALEPRRLFAASITGLSLINADTGQSLGAITEGQTIDLSKLPTKNLNIRADASGALSVKFGLDSNSSFRVENVAPYALAGDNSSVFNKWTPAVGSHTVTATPYSSTGATGTTGTAQVVHFNIVSSTITPDDPTDPTDPTGPADGKYEYTLSAGQALSSIAPHGGDDVRLTGAWSKISIPWSGSSGAPIHLWFDSTSTVGNGQSGTVFSGGTYLDIHRLHVTGVSNGLQIASAAAKISTGTSLVDSIVENTTGTGLGITGSNITVRRSTFRYNGQQGLVIQSGNGVLVADSKILNNNNGVVSPPWVGFTLSGYNVVQSIGGKYYIDPNWEAGGDKVWTSTNVTFSNNEAAYNVGPGLWTDYKNTNITMTGNYVHDNRGLDSSRNYQGEGIRLELSKDIGNFTITNNRLINNTGAGVTLTSVTGVQIKTNTFSGNKITGILLRNDDSRGAISNVLASGNTYSGSVYAVWGSRFPLSNVLIEGKTL